MTNKCVVTVRDSYSCNYNKYLEKEIWEIPYPMEIPRLLYSNVSNHVSELSAGPAVSQLDQLLPILPHV